MANELVEAQQGGVPTITYTRDQMDLIKRTYATDATDDELALFVYASKRLSLDILARQIHFTKRAGKTVFIVSIDGYRLNAERTGKYAPGKEPTFTYDDKGSVVSATAYVKKFIAGEWHETAATAFMSEYKPDEKSDWMWRKMPHNQLAKCAEALALRRAFPKDLGDTVTEDEMAQVREPVNATPIREPQKKSAPKSDLPESSLIFNPKSVEERTGKKTGKWYFVVKLPGGDFANGFDKGDFDLLNEARASGQEVKAGLTLNGEYKNISNVVKVSQAEKS